MNIYTVWIDANNHGYILVNMNEYKIGTCLRDLVNVISYNE